VRLGEDLSFAKGCHLLEEKEEGTEASEYQEKGGNKGKGEKRRKALFRTKEKKISSISQERGYPAIRN